MSSGGLRGLQILCRALECPGWVRFPHVPANPFGLNRGLFWGFLFLAAVAGPALGQDRTDPEAPVPISQDDGERLVPAAGGDSGGPWHRTPTWIMVRSIVIPGWGQLANGRYWKALLVAAGEGYFIGRAFHYTDEEDDYRALARSSPEDSEQRADYERLADYAGDRRRDSVWWAIFSAVLSMGDAYVDAQLGRNFDLEFEPQDRGMEERESGEPQVRLGLQWKLP